MEHHPVDPVLHPAGGVVLRLEGVCKAFGSLTVIEDASFTVGKGELLTLLGPSGCGKTTLLRLVMGLERADAGAIHYQGRLVDAPAQDTFVPPEKRHMGMVFQSYAIWPHLSVFENVAYPLRVRRVGGTTLHAEVRRALSLVGLERLEDRRATLLSGGEQQRVAFARALVFHPELLLLDEPFSNLDAHLREQMRTEVKLLQRQLEMTVLFVTHDQVEALSLSDRLAVVNAGHIEQVGTPEALYDAPATPFVRDFLGRTVLLPSRVVGTAGATDVLLALEGAPDVRLRARPPRAAVPHAGDVYELAVRPERLAVTPNGTGGSEANRVPATLEARFFVGDRYEARLRLPGGQHVLAPLPRTPGWSPGQTVTLTFAPEAADLWPT
jgi:ABC-type Fe3+/spermidine/putrescine transport system ATPase subunit